MKRERNTEQAGQIKVNNEMEDLQPNTSDTTLNRHFSKKTKKKKTPPNQMLNIQMWPIKLQND